MPIYVKDVSGWRTMAPKNSAEQNLFNKSFISRNVSRFNGGMWQDQCSVWVKVKDKWQQVYQKPIYENNRLKCIVFLGDSITWGYGVDVYNTYPTYIQKNINTGPLGNKTNIAQLTPARSIIYDDLGGASSPFNGGGYASRQFYTTSPGVKYIEEGPFSNFKGTKNSTYSPATIYVP